MEDKTIEIGTETPRPPKQSFWSGLISGIKDKVSGGGGDVSHTTDNSVRAYKDKKTPALHERGEDGRGLVVNRNETINSTKHHNKREPKNVETKNGIRILFNGNSDTKTDARETHERVSGHIIRENRDVRFSQTTTINRSSTVDEMGPFKFMDGITSPLAEGVGRTLGAVGEGVGNSIEPLITTLGKIAENASHVLLSLSETLKMAGTFLFVILPSGISAAFNNPTKFMGFIAALCVAMLFIPLCFVVSARIFNGTTSSMDYALIFFMLLAAILTAVSSNKKEAGSAD